MNAGPRPLAERLAAAVPTAIPPAEGCVLPAVIEHRAGLHPDAPLVQFADGSGWSYNGGLEELSDAAHALAALGVAQNDRVLLCLPNGPELIRSWWGANQLGAAAVPINTAYKGRLLEHAVNSSGAEVAVVHSDIADRLLAVDTPKLRRVVVVGEDQPGASAGSVEFVEASALRSGKPDPARPPRPVEPWDLQTIIYTSGTTGPSKGVLSSYFHLANTAMVVAALHDVVPTDRLLMYFPLFHVGGTIPTTAMILRGASVAVLPAFDTRQFWGLVRRHEATVIWLTSNMATFLLKEPPSPADRGHPVRTAAIVHNGKAAADFIERFGVRGVTMFNQTEACMPIVSEIDVADQRFTGRLRPGLAGRVVDENDCEVPTGEIGELVLRSDLPWALNHGYNGNPEATTRAWRNGWWHTGDRFRVDADGNYLCIDRMNDTIRRRGESISPLEVETELLAFPAVREAAVVGVPSGDDSNDVLAVVAPVPGQAIDPGELFEFLTPRLAHFMLPRYIIVQPELPTNNGRVMRHELRTRGLTADAWDREAHGYTVKRDRLR